MNNMETEKQLIFTKEKNSDIYQYGRIVTYELRKILQHLPDINNVDNLKAIIFCDEDGKLDKVEFRSKNDIAEKEYVLCTSIGISIMDSVKVIKKIYKYSGWEEIYNLSSIVKIFMY